MVLKLSSSFRCHFKKFEKNSERLGIIRRRTLRHLFLYRRIKSKDFSLYYRLNSDLSAIDRDSKVPKWRCYLYYLYQGLLKIPNWKGNQDVYRGVNKNLVELNPQKYVIGGEITWYSFISTSTNFTKTKEFLSKT